MAAHLALLGVVHLLPPRCAVDGDGLVGHARRVGRGRRRSTSRCGRCRSTAGGCPCRRAGGAGPGPPRSRSRTRVVLGLSMPHSSAPLSVTCAVITPLRRKVLSPVRVRRRGGRSVRGGRIGRGADPEDGLELVEGPARGERRGGRRRQHRQRQLAGLDQAELLASLLLDDGVGLELVIEVVESLVLGPQRVELPVALGQGSALSEPRLHGEDEERGHERHDHQHGHRADREPAVAAPAEGRRVVPADGPDGSGGRRSAPLSPSASRPPSNLGRARRRAGAVVGALRLPTAGVEPVASSEAFGLRPRGVGPVTSVRHRTPGPVRPGLGRRRTRRGRPRCAAAGCTWPPGRSGPARRS